MQSSGTWTGSWCIPKPPPKPPKACVWTNMFVSVPIQANIGERAAHKAWYKTVRKEDDQGCEEDGMQEPCEGPEPCPPTCLPLRERRSRYCVCRLVVRAGDEKGRRWTPFLRGGRDWLCVLVGHGGCKKVRCPMSRYISGPAPELRGAWSRNLAEVWRLDSTTARTRPQLTQDKLRRCCA